MQARRHQERALTCTHMVTYLKKHHPDWLKDYIPRQNPGCGYDNLLSLIQDFCQRYGYTHQLACKSKKKVTDLESTRDLFAVLFHETYGAFSDDCVYNVDDMGIQFDMPPRYIWSKKGSGPSYPRAKNIPIE
ncbi:hypothetical protein DYB32_007544 [Aphanomyces invadans]|uniref:DDE-1 domain-containing protein n=1 Tax=Aphanomyces invadans TaxID=157072 RepID=A0A418ANP2_9STRA|nr:hypothetical protein DYB32_007544 [Aphanomyces invadans]